MYKLQAFLILSIPLALLSVFNILYGLVFTASKLPDKSERTDFENSHKPWFEPKSNKVIFILVDALRFDFLINQSEDPLLPENWAEYQFSNFTKALNETPENSVILKAYVDAPTLTTARVPCMMSGNFPLKASNFHHFGGLPVIEDNILHQLTQAGRKSYFAGDPLWPQFFPNDFVNSSTIRGYDIKDYEVDKESFEFLWDVFRNKKFDFLVGHFLGIDHMGHSTNLLHLNTILAKNKIEDFLLKLMQEMDDETTLIVIGDHGAELSGEHGKDSFGETHVPIVGYNKKGFQKNLQNGDTLAKVMKNLYNGDQVKQVDIVPTLAMLLGVPIPFSNFGQIIDDFYLAGQFPIPEKCSERAFQMQMLYNNYVNSAQIMKYLEAKQAESKLFSRVQFEDMLGLFKNLDLSYSAFREKFDNPQTECENIDEDLTKLILRAQDFSNKADNLVKNSNAYDFFITSSGVVGVMLTLISAFLLHLLFQKEGYQNKLTLRINLLWSEKVLPVFAINLVAVLSTFMLANNIIYSFTVCSLILQGWYSGSLAISLTTLYKSQSSIKTPKNQDGATIPNDSNIPSSDKTSSPTKVFNTQLESDTTVIVENEDENETFIGFSNPKIVAMIGKIKSCYEASSLKLLFSHPFIYKYTAIVIIALTLFFSYAYDLAEVRRTTFIPNAPVTGFFVIGCLAASNFRRFFPLIMLGTIVFCSLVYFDVFSFYDWRKSVPFGLFIASEWFLKEIYFMLKKLKTTRLMAFLQLSSAGVMFAYLTIKNQETFVIDIIIPRVLWALLLSTITAGKIQKIGKHATKRNLQFCLVVFLFMLRIQKQVLHFAILLQVMNLTNKLFQKGSRKNTLYPTVLGSLGYLGLYYIYMTDRYVPFTFVPAFTGLSDFNIFLCPLFYLMYLLASMILSTLFMSYYNQDLDLATENKSKDLLPQIKTEKAVEDEVQVAAIIQKRNIFPLVIFYAIILAAACLQTFYFCVANQPFTFEKFILDASFYLYILACGIFFFF